jgi:uncharacterized protein YutE (UPF0331/DUF86 family)
MPDDVILNKAASIERCLARIQEVYGGKDTNLLDNITSQDSVILNLQRACEASIDLAMYMVRKRKLGIPQESRDAFSLLQTGGIIDQDLADRLKRMVGFRNVAVHDYAALNLHIVKTIITERLEDFTAFTKIALQLD